MKILTRKKQNEILKRLCANGIIFESSKLNYQYIDEYIKNALEIAELVGGLDGVIKYLATMSNWLDDKLQATEHDEIMQ